MKLINKTLAIIGLGYVGLPLAVEFGKHFPVIGFDIDCDRIAELRAGIDRTLECCTEDLNSAKRLTYSSQAADLHEAEVFIVTVPTPVDLAHRPDLRFLVNASETVGKVLKRGDVVIYESTVYPGATEEVCVPVLEETSGLVFNTDFFCGYSPERLSPGDKQRRLPTIKKVTSGSTPETADAVDELYAAIVSAGTHKASSIKVAEAAKVIENTQRDLNIAFVNELSVLFDRLGIDTLEVLDAASSKWNFMPFRPGLVGGHCIGVDPYYLTHKAEEVGYSPQVIHAGRRINDNMGRYVARNTIKLMLQNGLDVARCRVGVLGITFKENCPDVRNSKVVDLVRELGLWGANIVVADPWANAGQVLKEYGITLGEINGSNTVDALVIAVGHDQYKQLTARDVRGMVRGDKPVLSDVKGLFDKREMLRAGFSVFRL